jgi:hypothetical protein
VCTFVVIILVFLLKFSERNHAAITGLTKPAEESTTAPTTWLTYLTSTPTAPIAVTADVAKI